MDYTKEQLYDYLIDVLGYSYEELEDKSYNRLLDLIEDTKELYAYTEGLSYEEYILLN